LSEEVEVLLFDSFGRGVKSLDEAVFFAVVVKRGNEIVSIGEGRIESDETIEWLRGLMSRRKENSEVKSDS